MVVNVLVIYPHDQVVSWELSLAATVQNDRRVSYCRLLAWEKIKIQSIVSTECITLSHFYKVKCYKPNH